MAWTHSRCSVPRHGAEVGIANDDSGQTPFQRRTKLRYHSKHPCGSVRGSALPVIGEPRLGSIRPDSPLAGAGALWLSHRRQGDY